MSPEKAGPLRKLIGVTSCVGPRQTVWKLECGHEVCHKRSVPVPVRAHCRSCADETRPDEPGSRRCRVCGCTDEDCSGCIERTGEPCHWVEADLCSACEGKS